jgi:hypothetical protein
MSAFLEQVETGILKQSLELVSLIYANLNKEQEFRIVKTILEKIEIEELNQKEIRIGDEISKESETG